MGGIVNTCIKKCIRRGKNMKVASRYLRMKFKISMGDIAIKNRFNNFIKNN